MKSLDLFCAFSPQLFSLAVSLDSIRIDCALNEAMIKVHPIAEWWVSQLSISQSIKIGLSFVHPHCVCTWLGSCQPRAAMACHHLLSIQVSNAFSYDNFCSPLLNTISQRTLVIDFSLSFGFTGPGYSMPSSARSSAKQVHVGVKKTSTPIFLTCSTHWLLHWWSRGSYTDDIRWRRLVYRLMMLKALLPFPVGTYLSTLFGSIYSCSRKTSRSNYPFTSPPKNLHFSFTIVLMMFAEHHF